MATEVSSVLLVDDDDSFREVMRYHLAEAGIPAETAADGRTALERFRRTRFPVVVSDLKMPGMDGLALLEELHRLAPDTLVIVITAFGDVETAVGAMKRGAWDFVPKPTERSHFVMVVRRALDHAALHAEVRELRRSDSASKELVFASEAMRRLIDTVDRVADSDASVVLLGESGTGKELLARRLHRQSPRAGGPLVAVNCAAIPRDLLESELFGHRKGAFTGAVSDRQGRFEQASGGTLFLDEIAEMPLELQPRLLRVLQERAVDVVGGNRPVPVDIRIVAATNRDLGRLVAEGRFREDLFYRLSIVTLEIPPLRDRREDIAPLAEFFLNRFAPNRALQLSPELLRRLEAHAWPGNVRELENTCQRLALLAQDERLSPELLPPDFGRPLAAGTELLPGVRLQLPPDGADLRELEREVVRLALERNDGNQSAAARFLRIPRHVLLYRLEKYGITVGTEEAGE
jgi:DNA-binding NtrC family response regulator